MVQNLDNHQQIVDMKQLPPGFRFDPTDEELVLHFLYSKLTPPSSNSHNHNLNLIIPELEDFYDHYHPCQLHHGDAFESYGQWYFYTKRTDNRVSENGYWKELVDIDQPIIARNSNKAVGFKKYLVFYHQKSPSSSSGVQTRWLMQEYHAFNNDLVADEKNHHGRRSKHLDANKWVLCRVQQICDDLQSMTNIFYDQERHDNEVELSSSDEAVLLAMDDDDDDDDEDEISYPH